MSLKCPCWRRFV